MTNVTIVLFKPRSWWLSDLVGLLCLALVMVFSTTFNNISVFYILIIWRKQLTSEQEWRLQRLLFDWLVGWFNATFSNISVITWRSVLLVEETGENHRPVTSHWQTLSHNVVNPLPCDHNHDCPLKIYSIIMKAVCAITYITNNIHVWRLCNVISAVRFRMCTSYPVHCMWKSRSLTP